MRRSCPLVPANGISKSPGHLKIPNLNSKLREKICFKYSRFKEKDSNIRIIFGLKNCRIRIRIFEIRGKRFESESNLNIFDHLCFRDTLLVDRFFIMQILLFKFVFSPSSKILQVTKLYQEIQLSSPSPCSFISWMMGSQGSKREHYVNFDILKCSIHILLKLNFPVNGPGLVFSQASTAIFTQILEAIIMMVLKATFSFL